MNENNAVNNSNLVKGDILIIKKEPYPGARKYNVEDVEYILVFGKLYRPYASDYALREGHKKLEYDRDWPMTEFNDEHIIMKLGGATKKHNEFIKKLHELPDQMIEWLCEVVGANIAYRKVSELVTDVYKEWLVGFLLAEYQNYRKTYHGHQD